MELPFLGLQFICLGPLVASLVPLMFIKPEGKKFPYWLLGYVVILVGTLVLMMIVIFLNASLSSALFGSADALHEVDRFGIVSSLVAVAIPTVAAMFVVKLASENKIR